MNNILSYIILILIVAGFASFHFFMIKKSVNKVTSNEKAFNYIYISFLLRLVLAFVFFYLLLKYYNDIRQIAVIIITFIFVKWLFVRYEKRKIKKGKNK